MTVLVVEFNCITFSLILTTVVNILFTLAKTNQFPLTLLHPQPPHLQKRLIGGQALGGLLKPLVKKTI